MNKVDVTKIIEVLVINAINKYLLLPDVRFGSKKIDKLESLDSAPDILQSKKADLQIDTKSPTVSKVVKKSVEQSEKTLTLDKLIIEEVKNDTVGSKIMSKKMILNNLNKVLITGTDGVILEIFNLNSLEKYLNDN